MMPSFEARIMSVRIIKYLFSLLLVGDSAIGVLSVKNYYGHVQGYLSDCPGTAKPASITNRSLRHLAISIAGGDGSYLFDERRTYYYHQAKDMVKDPNLDLKNKKTIFFFGGFLDTVRSAQSGYMAQAYRRQGYNVLLLEYNFFVTIHYPISIRLLRPVGTALAEMLTNLTTAGLDPKRLEFTGMSLGAQAMSFVAKSFYRLTGKKVSLITGLDPAGPCLRFGGPEDRLDASDGEHVQAIFTNIDGLGMGPPLAHTNFYINGGEHQPGDGYFMPCTDPCSHTRAYTIWLSALYSPSYFIGMKCDSVQQARRRECYDRVPRETIVITNIKIDKNKTGIFYVATTADWPYYLGSKGLLKEYEYFRRKLASYNKDDVIEV